MSLVEHEEAHATVARAMGWTVVGATYSPRGASAQVSYLAPLGDLGTWRELWVTLAGVVFDLRHYGDAYDVVERLIMRHARRVARGFYPKRSDDYWKVARILAELHDEDETRLEGLREAWEEVCVLLDQPVAIDRPEAVSAP